jgi:gamma-glutamyltranspeptidase/glutathione hydrolase
LKDLAAYRVVERKPLIGEYHGARIVSASPPSSGGVAVLDALNILSGFDLRSVDSATRKHLIIEAMRRAYRDRAVYLGDPDFVKTCRWRSSSSSDYAAGQRTSIRTDKAMPSDMLPGIESAPVGHAHHAFLGSGCRRQPRGGDHLDQSVLRLGRHAAEDRRAAQRHHGRFLRQARHAECVRLVGNARTPSRPTSVPVEHDADLRRDAEGPDDHRHPGGSYIISMVLLGTLDYLNGMSAADIVKDPRYHHQYLPDVVDYEKGRSRRRARSPAAGHGPHAQGGQPAWGNMQVITWDFRQRQGGGGLRSARRGRGVGLLRRTGLTLAGRTSTWSADPGRIA